MRESILGMRGGLLGFVVVTLLVLGGLGWVTADALRLEQEQIEVRAANEQAHRLRLALWRLDSRVFTVLAREEARPYEHYSAVYAATRTINSRGYRSPPGTVLEPSPLVDDELPNWIKLHFHFDSQGQLTSPQVPNQSITHCLSEADFILSNITTERASALEVLRQRLGRDTLLAELPPAQPVSTVDLPLSTEPLSAEPLAAENLPESTQPPAQQPAQQAGQPQYGQPQYGQPQAGQAPANQPYPNGPPLAQSDVPKPQVEQEFAVQQGLYGDVQQLQGFNEFDRRMQQRNNVQKDAQVAQSKGNPSNYIDNSRGNGAVWISGQLEQPTTAPVALGPLTPIWMPSPNADLLLVARSVQIGPAKLCQGMWIDWPALRQTLLDEVVDLFPQAKLQAIGDGSTDLERNMSALPISLSPGPLPPLRLQGWSPLRIGLALAWLAALVALAAVGAGGWMLWDLSQRRIRFVSAVTHELRTPLTTLRLYLDMLVSGLITDETRKTEYLHTLNGEADRLHRLISNVLDFSRLENQSPRLELVDVSLDELLTRMQQQWDSRCRATGKQLVLENTLPPGVRLHTDERIIEQIVGNLIENACKYSQGAIDPQVHLRAGSTVSGQLELTVEDAGPGVPLAERRAIFRPFRRGTDQDSTTSGVGLGLALAHRWARLLGGGLQLQTPGRGGASFKLTVPGCGERGA